MGTKNDELSSYNRDGTQFITMSKTFFFCDCTHETLQMSLILAHLSNFLIDSQFLTLLCNYLISNGNGISRIQRKEN